MKNEEREERHGCWVIDAPGDRRKGTPKFVKHLTSSRCFRWGGAIVWPPEKVSTRRHTFELKTDALDDDICINEWMRTAGSVCQMFTRRLFFIYFALDATKQ